MDTEAPPTASSSSSTHAWKLPCNKCNTCDKTHGRIVMCEVEMMDPADNEFKRVWIKGKWNDEHFAVTTECLKGPVDIFYVGNVVNTGDNTVREVQHTADTMNKPKCFRIICKTCRTEKWEKLLFNHIKSLGERSPNIRPNVLTTVDGTQHSIKPKPKKVVKKSKKDESDTESSDDTEDDDSSIEDFSDSDTEEDEDIPKKKTKSKSASFMDSKHPQAPGAPKASASKPKSAVAETFKAILDSEEDVSKTKETITPLQMVNYSYASPVRPARQLVCPGAPARESHSDEFVMSSALSSPMKGKRQRDEMSLDLKLKRIKTLLSEAVKLMEEEL